jgi:hypothetical protein
MRGMRGMTGRSASRHVSMESSCIVLEIDLSASLKHDEVSESGENDRYLQ